MTISEPEVHVSADGGESKVAVVITNPAQDGSINATTDASWITITSVNETSVAFTTSENTETSERNATITVTYTYGGGKTIDAGITVTQEAAQSSSQYDYDYILVAYSGYKAGSNFYATFADKEYTSVGEPNTTYYKLDLYSDNSTNSDFTAGTYTLSESTGAPMTFSKKYSNGASYNEYRDYAWNVKFAEGTIYTTNWIERLQKDFRRVTRMRGAMPNEESVILLMGKTAMDKKSYLRQVPRIDLDKVLFPDE